MEHTSVSSPRHVNVFSSADRQRTDCSLSVVCSFRLFVSKVDFVRRYTTQFSLWCIAKAVLLLGCDLSAPLIANGTAADFYEIVSRAHDIAGIWVAFFSRRQLAAILFLPSCGRRPRVLLV